MIALQQPPPAVTLTAYERDIVAALEDGCYILRLDMREQKFALCDNRKPWYKRIVPKAILINLLTAGLVAEAAAGVWTKKGQLS